jgi:hypothetical protein
MTFSVHQCLCHQISASYHAGRYEAWVRGGPWSSDASKRLSTPWALLAYNSRICSAIAGKVGDRLVVLRGRRRVSTRPMALLDAVGRVVCVRKRATSGRPSFRCLGQVAIGHQRGAELLPGIEQHLVQRVVGRAQLVSQNIDRHAVEDRRNEHKALAS